MHRGLAGALGVTQFFRGLLFEIQPNDPATLVGVTGVVVLTSLLACYFPARRAIKVDPAVTLREE